MKDTTGGSTPNRPDRKDSRKDYGQKGPLRREGNDKDEPRSKSRPSSDSKDDRGAKREYPKSGRPSNDNNRTERARPESARRDSDRDKKPAYPKRDRPATDSDRRERSRPEGGRRDSDRDKKPAYPKRDRPATDSDRRERSRPEAGRRDSDRDRKPSYPKRDRPAADGDRRERTRPESGGRDYAGGKKQYPERERPERSSRDTRKGDKPDYQKRTRPTGESADGDRRQKTGYEKKEMPSTGKGQGDNFEFRKRSRPEGDARPEKKSRSREESTYNPDRRKETLRSDAPVRLNKFIAHAGICSRREADSLIENGAISVNGVLVTELGTKVNPDDIVRYGDQRLINERKVYILLNKPKDYITTSEDPQGRKTVLDLVYKACRERVYPVGRLDRNTTGLLLFTNDGEMAKKLTHPRHGVTKIYHVHLDKPLTKADMMEIAQGVELEDTKIVPDSISYVDGNESKKEVGIEIHSGQNRVVRRVFEKFGYDVEKLDRVSFAGLTKKDLPRGKWRFLSEKEVNFLKMRK